MVGLGAAVGQASWHPADRLPEPQLTIVASLHKAPIKAPARPAIEIAEPLVPPLLPHPPPAVAGPMLSPSPRPAPAEAVTAPSNPPAAPRQTETADLPGFGVRLATAALEQTRQPVSYDPRYFKIGYPMGDVPAELGVCTDVIVRAYRTFGIDLQELVHLTKVGPGDTNIDHRRVEVLRKFFARFGETLVPTEYAEDYLPGDIVIYSRPGRPHKTSTTHVAMVTGVLAPSGRPMLVHNRGYGPMLEDALFADPITGHYRFRTTDAQQVAALAGRPRPAPVLAKARRLATTSKSSVSAR